METRAGSPAPTTAAVILAAGQGKRMRSPRPKVLHLLRGRPLLGWVLDAAAAAGLEPVVAVVGAGRREVVAAFPDRPVRWAVQAEQRGTGDAVRAAGPALRGYEGDLVVLNGDLPLVRPDTIRLLLACHRGAGAGATAAACRLPDPTGYGRILRDAAGNFRAIVEQADCDERQAALDEVNAGAYVLRAPGVFADLEKLGCANAQKEVYLTDLLGLYAGRGRKVALWPAPDWREFLGVNSPADLERLEALLAPASGAPGI